MAPMSAPMVRIFATIKRAANRINNSLSVVFLLDSNGQSSPRLSILYGHTFLELLLASDRGRRAVHSNPKPNCAPA